MNIIDVGLQFNSNYNKMKEIEGVVLHNSGVTVLQSVEAIHNYHKNKGWAGIGYQYYVRKDGRIYRGRTESMEGAHCVGVNGISIGICAEGNFNEETMSNAQKNSIIELIKDIKSRYNIKWIRGHRELLATSCPGTNFPIEEIKNAVMNNTNSKEAKSIEDLAVEVIAGKYGNGDARKQALGPLYNEVQDKVNEILLGNKTNKKSNEEIANEVIEGKWGNNPSRKEKLVAAGYDYNAIQSIVNRKLR